MHIAFPGKNSLQVRSTGRKMDTANRKLGALLLLAGLGTFLLTTPVQAQFFSDEFGSGFGGNGEFAESEDVFLEDAEQTGGPGAEDFTSGGEFIEESRLSISERDAITEGGRRAQLRLVGEKEMLPFNGGWGAGTGLLIGGWFALIREGGNRETLRSIGLGIVIGTLVGIAVGTKSLLVPDAPQPISLYSPRFDSDAGRLLAYGPTTSIAILNLQFSF